MTNITYKFIVKFDQYLGDIDCWARGQFCRFVTETETKTYIVMCLNDPSRCNISVEKI